MPATTNDSQVKLPQPDEQSSPEYEVLTEEQRRERFMELLFEAGMIRERKPRTRTIRERPPLIEIEGEPLSETIIKERP